MPGTVLGAQERAEQGKHYTFSQRTSEKFLPHAKISTSPDTTPRPLFAVGMMGKLVLLSSSNLESLQTQS